MRDDYLTQSWASSHHAVSDAIAAALKAAAVGLARLNAKQFDAPWRRDDHTPAPRC